MSEGDQFGLTPIHMAVASGAVNNVQCLVSHGPDMNIRDINGKTPLHGAAERPEMSELIEILLAKGAEIDAKDLSDRTPISIAVKCGLADNVQCLAGQGADLNLPNVDGDTLLHAAAGSPKMREVIEILLANEARINEKDRFGRTPIHVAVLYDQLDNVRCLVVHEADVNLPDFHKMTPLHAAVRSEDGSGSITEILLADGADVNARTIEGKNPLHCLERSNNSYNNTIIIEELLEHGVDINAQDIDGKTPLHCVVHSPEIVKVYLRGGANINIESNEGRTQLELAQYLIRFAGNIDLHKLTSKYLVQLIIKLRVAGLFASEKNIEMANSIMSRPYGRSNRVTEDQVQKYNQRCELDLYKWNSNFSILLRKFLTTKYPNYISNTELCDRLETINKSDYPVYGDLILDKFKRDKKRFSLLEHCKSIFTRAETERALPEDIWGKILSNLSDASLKRVVDCSIKRRPGLNRSVGTTNAQITKKIPSEGHRRSLPNT